MVCHMKMILKKLLDNVKISSSQELMHKLFKGKSHF